MVPDQDGFGVLVNGARGKIGYNWLIDALVRRLVPIERKQLVSIVWTIAGSDSGGGAGIQADLKTIHSLGLHGCSVITAVTAQNSVGVQRASVLEPALVRAQLASLTEDLPPRAVKIGMAGDAAVMEEIAAALERLAVPVICDPVMVATSGGVLLPTAERKALVEKLLPRATLLTPNLPEAEALLGRELKGDEALESAARDLRAMGPRAVLIKGGHGSGTYSQDYYQDETRGFWLTSERVATEDVHGTGCTLSSAIASAVALGYELADALVIAKAFVTRGLRESYRLGAGPGPVAQLGWPEADLPWLSPSAAAGRERTRFPRPEESLGFYPVVDRVEWLDRLLPLGVKTVQLRVKDLEGEALRAEIAAAVERCNRYQARLFVNDYWRLALELGAHGVHLGQEDLEALSWEDLRELEKSGILLGLSTHCYREVARALACRPSYIAIGPIYETTLKQMAFEPQGLEMLARWRRALDAPLVAIGGISLERAPSVLAMGVDSIAVVSAVTRAQNPEGATRSFLKLFRAHQVRQ